MQRYVLGFLFDRTGENVLLITKNRPAWQAGKLNGVGGKCLDLDEPAIDAMHREFQEETGLENLAWREFVTVSYPDALIVCFAAYSTKIWQAESTTDEPVSVRKVAQTLARGEIIPNLRFLVPMARYTLFEERMLPTVIALGSLPVHARG